MKNTLKIKQIFLFTCTFFVLCTSIVLANSAAGDKSSRFPFFIDISPDHKDFEAVTYLHSHDMVNGYSDNTFLPNRAISRVESIKLLLEASKKTIQKSSSNTFIFTDIPSEKWFSNYVYTAKKIGVINPDGEVGTGNFNPTRTVNRAEAIKMILEVNNVSVLSANTGEQWFYPYFKKANELHIFNKHYRNDELNILYSYAADNLTRGEISTYMYRYILSESRDLRNDISGNNSANLSADMFGDTSSNPLKINALFSKGLLTLEWNAGKFDKFVVHMIQKQENNRTEEVVFNVTGNSITFTTKDLKKFKIGLIEFKIKKSEQLVARFILPVYTKFTPYISNEFTVHAEATTYQYGYLNKKISVQIDKKSQNIDGIDFSKYKIYVLNSTENLYEKSVTSYNENSLYFEFTPQIKDLYIIEISDEFGLAKAVIPVTPYGFFPILPNNLDILESVNTNKNYSNSEIIQKINVLRQKHGVSPVIEKIELSSLAQIRARDMKERKYLGHYTPEGLSVNDMRSDYSLTSSLSENLATHSRGSAFAAIGLEYSPTHRKTLLNPELQYVGVATEKLENGEVLLVEVFQDIVLEQTDIDAGEILLYNYISENFPSQNADIILQNISEDWSKIMVEKRSAQTDFTDGSSWKNILNTYNVTESTGIFVLSHQTPVKMKEYFEENPTILSEFFAKKVSYGLSIKMDSMGVVYLTLIGSE
ncbi:TPA: hypothetical protein EYP45_00895 [Candidatus Peregrinibacteria bacterium]|nr:hypothetical protein [Candidatus Peregrinibacteria bacterium]